MELVRVVHDRRPRRRDRAGRTSAGVRDQFDPEDGKVQRLIVDALGLPVVPEEVVSTYAIDVSEILSSGADRIIVAEGAEAQLRAAQLEASCSGCNSPRRLGRTTSRTTETTTRATTRATTRRSSRIREKGGVTTTRRPRRVRAQTAGLRRVSRIRATPGANRRVPRAYV